MISQMRISLPYLVVVCTTVALVTYLSAPSCLSANSLKGRDLSHEDGVMLRLWLYQPIAIPETIVVDDEAVRQAIDIGC